MLAIENGFRRHGFLETGNKQHASIREPQEEAEHDRQYHEDAVVLEGKLKF